LAEDELFEGEWPSKVREFAEANWILLFRGFNAPGFTSRFLVVSFLRNPENKIFVIVLCLDVRQINKTGKILLFKRPAAMRRKRNRKECLTQIKTGSPVSVCGNPNQSTNQIHFRRNLKPNNSLFVDSSKYVENSLCKAATLCPTVRVLFSIEGCCSAAL